MKTTTIVIIIAMIALVALAITGIELSALLSDTLESWLDNFDHMAGF